MKILVLAQHPSHSIGGIEIQCDLLAREWQTAGHDVVFAAPTIRTGRYCYEIDRWDPSTPASLLRLLRYHRPDIVYVRHNKRGLRRAARTAYAAGVPLVYAVSSRQDVAAWSFHRSRHRRTPRRLLSIAWQCIKNRWNWSGLRYVSGAVCLNPDYAGRLPVPAEIIVFDSMDSKVVPFHWSRPFVAWVAQLKEYKNPHLYVELARRCADLELDFLMVGGLAHSQFGWIARREETPANFHYLGTMTPIEVNGFLAASELLVHTCDPEGFGNNFIQAWQQGKATLSLHFDPAGIIFRERLGAVPGSMEGLERELRRFMSDLQLRTETGERARAFAAGHHDPATNAARIAAFLEAVVAQASS